MTKHEAIDFLTAQGHISEVEKISDDVSRISFKYRGKSIGLYTTESDPAFLFLKCDFPFDAAGRDELAVLRVMTKVDENYKVAKTAYDPEASTISATAQQFLPACPEFAALFWRTTGLVASAATEARDEVSAIAAGHNSSNHYSDGHESQSYSEAP